MANIPKVAIIELVIPEYKVHLFGGLHQAGTIQVLVFHGGIGDKDGPPAYEMEMPFPQIKVRAFRVPVWRGKALHYQCVISKLAQYRPDVVIMQDGVRILSNVIVRAWCKRKEIPVAFYTHGRNHQARDRGRMYGAVVEGIRFKLLRGADAAIAYSRPVADELVSRGIPKAKVFISPNTLDVNRVVQEVARVSSAEFERVRRGLRVRSEGVVLFIGRLIKEKRPEMLVEAAKIARDAGKPFHVVIVGDGPLRSNLERLVTRFTPLSVSLLGHLPSDKVAPYLRLADIVCVPGMTGLVIVHALAAGRPYVTCASVNHSPEICYLRDGENGRMVSPPTAETLAGVLTSMLANSTALRMMGERARAFALSECDPIKQRDGFVEAVTSLVARKQLGRMNDI